MNELCLRNRQKARAINAPLLRRLARQLLTKLVQTPRFEIGIHLVSKPEMARLNERFLNHTGSTDVITFQYDSAPPAESIQGDIFISIEDALQQAQQFHTSWQAEVVRYLIHGILHLKGFDDVTPAARKQMKREENRLLKEMMRLFPLRDLERRQPVSSSRGGGLKH